LNPITCAPSYARIALAENYNKKLTEPSKTQKVRPNTAPVSRTALAALAFVLVLVLVLVDEAPAFVVEAAPLLLPVATPVLPGLAEVVPFVMPSPPDDFETAGQVKLNSGVVERFDVIWNLASLAGFESLRLYHQTLVLPKIEHPTSSQ
jgi:hypothetical protein